MYVCIDQSIYFSSYLIQYTFTLTLSLSIYIYIYIYIYIHNSIYPREFICMYVSINLSIFPHI